MSAKVKSRGLSHYIPILGWLPRYNRSWFSADLIAGLSVWALLVPQGITYASIAGVPAQFGLYTALGALIGYALFGTYKQLVTGPSATVAAVSFSVIGLLAAGPARTQPSGSAIRLRLPSWSASSTWRSAFSRWARSPTFCPRPCSKASSLRSALA